MNSYDNSTILTFRTKDFRIQEVFINDEDMINFFLILNKI